MLRVFLLILTLWYSVQHQALCTLHASQPFEQTASVSSTSATLFQSFQKSNCCHHEESSQSCHCVCHLSCMADSRFELTLSLSAHFLFPMLVNSFANLAISPEKEPPRV